MSFDNSYAQLPERFCVRLDPTPTVQPRLIKFNCTLAAELGLDVSGVSGVSADTLAQLFSRNLRLKGAEPLAMAYAGHQFGHFVPKLGDGRAILLGEVRDVAGARRDIQLKGLNPVRERAMELANQELSAFLPGFEKAGYRGYICERLRPDAKATK